MQANAQANAQTNAHVKARACWEQANLHAGSECLRVIACVSNKHTCASKRHNYEKMQRGKVTQGAFPVEGENHDFQVKIMIFR